MSRESSLVPTSLLDWPRCEALLPDQRLILLWLWSSPYMSSCGCGRVPLRPAAATLGLSSEALQGGMQSLEEANLIAADRETGEIFIHDWFRFHKFLKPLAARILTSDLEKVESEALKKLILEKSSTCLPTTTTTTTSTTTTLKTKTNPSSSNDDGLAKSKNEKADLNPEKLNPEKKAVLQVVQGSVNPEQPVHENKTASPSESCFERFWSVFPKKVGKGAALSAWGKIKRPSETVELIVTALKWQTCSQQWLKDNGAYIPHPATYLNQQRWLDEPSSALAGSSNRHTGFGFGQYNLGTKAELRPGNRVVFKTGWGAKE